MNDWESTELDVKWAEQEADNWIYSQGLSKSADWTPEMNQIEHNAVIQVLLFSLQRLDIHVDHKTDNPNPAWASVEARPNVIWPHSACRAGYEYALSHVPVEVDNG